MTPVGDCGECEDYAHDNDLVIIVTLYSSFTYALYAKAMTFYSVSKKRWVNNLSDY
jgi:hypothetical protein